MCEVCNKCLLHIAYVHIRLSVGFSQDDAPKLRHEIVAKHRVEIVNVWTIDPAHIFQKALPIGELIQVGALVRPAVPANDRMVNEYGTKWTPFADDVFNHISLTDKCCLSYKYLLFIFRWNWFPRVRLATNQYQFCSYLNNTNDIQNIECNWLRYDSQIIESPNSKSICRSNSESLVLVPCQSDYPKQCWIIQCIPGILGWLSTQPNRTAQLHRVAGLCAARWLRIDWIPFV